MGNGLTEESIGRGHRSLILVSARTPVNVEGPARRTLVFVRSGIIHTL